jgi:hypothetical protein
MINVVSSLNQTNVRPNLGTAPSKTRVDSQTVSGGYQIKDNLEQKQATLKCDYLTLILEFANLGQAIDKFNFLADYLDDDIIWSKSQPKDLGRWFTNTYRTVRGGTIGYTVLEDGSVDAIAILSGQVLAASKPEQIVRALRHLDKYVVRCCRFDIAYDDPTHYVAELRSLAMSAYEQGLNSGFKKARIIVDMDRAKENLQTHYWGTRNGNRLVRLYDKPDIQATRFEVQTMRTTSAALYNSLISYLESGLDYLEAMSHVFYQSLDGINFFEDSKDVNLSRNKIANWWQKFLDMIDYEKIKLPKVELTKSIDRTKEWVKKQVAPSLAAVKQALGSLYPQWLHSILEDGKGRISSIHRCEIDRIKRDRKQNNPDWNNSEWEFA